MSLQTGRDTYRGPSIYAGPLYSQLTARLRDRIRFDDWTAGTLIPSEADLARDYGVSVGTARKALENLEKDGWVVRRQGRGTFVTDLAKQRMQRLCRLRTSIDGSGLDGYVVTLIENVCAPATDHEIAALGLGDIAGEPQVVRMTRRYFRDNSASMREVASFPSHIFADLEVSRAAPLNLFSILVDDYSIVPHHAKDQLTARTADMELAAALGIEVGAPILRVQSVVWDVDGRKVACIVRDALAVGMHYAADLS